MTRYSIQEDKKMSVDEFFPLQEIYQTNMENNHWILLQQQD